MVRKWQYANHTSTGDIHFRPTDLPVKRTISCTKWKYRVLSQAPHLPEIHDTRTWNMLDPLEFIQNEVTDKMPPVFMDLWHIRNQEKAYFGWCQYKIGISFTSPFPKSLFFRHGVR